MVQGRLATTAVTLMVLMLWTGRASAEMGPCAAVEFDLQCGSGNNAARVIVKTISPSRHIGFAWRLTGRPPGKPEENDPNLENLIVRLEDGAVLAKSHGAYWDLSTKIAKAYLMTAWSPDSRLLFKVEQREDSVSAELFAFAENDVTLGPVDLVKVIGSEVRTKMRADSNFLTFAFSAHPAMTIDNHGLLHAVVFAIEDDWAHGPAYDLTAQVTRNPDGLTSNVVSVTPHGGTSISIIVH